LSKILPTYINQPHLTKLTIEVLKCEVQKKYCVSAGENLIVALKFDISSSLLL